MMLLDASKSTFCADTAEIWSVIGKILFIFKIVIPILIIIFGMIDLGKAVVASKDDEIKKALKSLGMRAIAGVVIFFIPTLVGVVMSLVDSFGDIKDDYTICKNCIVSPYGQNCKSSVTKAKANS